MGACVSVHKQTTADKVVIPPEPINEKLTVNGDRPIAEGGLKSQWSQSHPVTAVHDFGSKEETFFDSQTWLESDCDDDFVSVNGDFTPSRGSTPLHQSFSALANRTLSDDKTPGSKPEPSPTSKKKLAELFRDSSRNKQDVDDQNMSTNQNGVTPRPEIGIPLIHPRTPNGGYTSEMEKQPTKSGQCCLPRMLSTQSYRERRKKTTPTPSLG